VTADGQPKLLDFGLAKIVDTSRDRLGEGDAETTPGAAELTMTGMRAFTPAYASPEQVRGGPIATATDVYSLGVVLYELLTGTRPLALDSGNIEDAARTLDEVMPPPPSDAVRRSARTAPAAPHSPAPLLEGDIDTIVMMALRKEPERRYSSVEAFADDVRRHLAGRPIAARPQTIRYRASRFVRRNRVAVAAAILVALALVGGAGIAVWQARSREPARSGHEAFRRRAGAVALAAVRNRPVGGTAPRGPPRPAGDAGGARAPDRLALEAGGAPLLQARSLPASRRWATCRATEQQRISEIGKGRQLREGACDRTALLAATPGDVGLRRGLAENARILGNIRAQANDYEGAGRDLETALREYDALAGSAAGDVSLTLALAQVQHDLGRNLSTSSRYAGAFPYFRRAIALAAPFRADRDRALDVARVLGDSRATRLALAGRPSARGRTADGGGAASTLVAAHGRSAAARRVCSRHAG
jgi:tetratricopeptide (TPR) repeat protein